MGCAVQRQLQQVERDRPGPAAVHLVVLGRGVEIVGRHRPVADECVDEARQPAARELVEPAIAPTKDSETGTALDRSHQSAGDTVM